MSQAISVIVKVTFQRLITRRNKRDTSKREKKTTDSSHVLD